jgi:hypothetical protein
VYTLWSGCRDGEQRQEPPSSARGATTGRCSSCTRSVWRLQPLPRESSQKTSQTRRTRLPANFPLASRRRLTVAGRTLAPRRRQQVAGLPSLRKYRAPLHLARNSGYATSDSRPGYRRSRGRPQPPVKRRQLYRATQPPEPVPTRQHDASGCVQAKHIPPLGVGTSPTPSLYRLAAASQELSQGIAGNLSYSHLPVRPTHRRPAHRRA